MANSTENTPRLDYVTCASPGGVHRMAYWEWGNPDNDQVLLCVHGLTRSGRDFDLLAERLSSHYRVVCPDIVGRGKSDWLVDPAYYTVPQYVSDMLCLIARLRPARLAWVGTSMGGLIAMGLVAALTLSERTRPPRGAHGLPDHCALKLDRLVLNDIGPHLGTDGLGRIAEYTGEAISFPSFDAAVDYLRSVSAEFGPHDQAGWQALARHVFVQEGDHWIKHYDLRIAQAMARETPETMAASEALLWTAYQALDVPVLIVHGEESDLLDTATIERMQAANPLTQVFTVAGVGHAPTLRSDGQLAPVHEFLLGKS